MVIVISQEGQLANRIWQISAYIINAKKNGYKFYHLFFDEYIEYFSENISDEKDFPVRFIKKGILKKSILKLYAFLDKKNMLNSAWFSGIVYYDTYKNGRIIFDLNQEDFIQRAKSKILFLKGWYFGDDLNNIKSRKYLQKIWTPNESIRVKINSKLTEIRKTAEIVIGVHIRRGDYRQFNGGIWYYEDEVYRNFLLNIQSFPELKDRRISFLICSHGLIDEKNFPGLHVITESRHFMEDLYLLSGSDYIIGPPSTYSMWASYYGEKPLLQIVNKNQTIHLSDFKTVDSFPINF